VLCRSTAAGQQRSRAEPGAGKRIEDRAELRESTKHPSGQSTSQQILSFFSQLFKAAKNKYNTDRKNNNKELNSHRMFVNKTKNN